MENLAEEIWKTIVYSLVVTSAVVLLMRYIDQDPWWKAYQKPISEESENNPLVYYSIVNANDQESVNAGLFCMNFLQQNLKGPHGVFDNIVPGQALSLKIISGSSSIRSPSFRLQEREIRHLLFAYKEDKLEYLGSRSRIRELKYPKALNIETKKLASANIIKAIENYRPIEKVEAKEKAKPSAKEKLSLSEQRLKNNNIYNFSGNINPLANQFPLYIFLHLR